MPLDKLGRFETLAEKRLTEVIKRIRLIGNLANRRNYEYTDQHVKQIIEALESELKNLKLKFRDEPGQEIALFKFKKK